MSWPACSNDHMTDAISRPMLGAILPVVVYYLLRAEKEGIGIDEIVEVFD
jgi:hypothetical protein